MEQRYVPLSFTAGAGALAAFAPANANIAPPGVYMLVVVDAAGVPSVARMVTMINGSTAPANIAPSVSITAPATGSSFPRGSTVTVSASASDSDGIVTRVDFLRNGTVVRQDTTPPYSWSWTNAGPRGTYTLTARAVDNRGATRTSAGVGVTIR
jgi:hypothetical protein